MSPLPNPGQGKARKVTSLELNPAQVALDQFGTQVGNGDGNGSSSTRGDPFDLFTEAYLKPASDNPWFDLESGGETIDWDDWLKFAQGYDTGNWFNPNIQGSDIQAFNQLLESVGISPFDDAAFVSSTPPSDNGVDVNIDDKGLPSEIVRWGNPRFEEDGKVIVETGYDADGNVVQTRRTPAGNQGGGNGGAGNGGAGNGGAGNGDVDVDVDGFDMNFELWLEEQFGVDNVTEAHDIIGRLRSGEEVSGGEIDLILGGLGYEEGMSREDALNLISASGGSDFFLNEGGSGNQTATALSAYFDNKEASPGQRDTEGGFSGGDDEGGGEGDGAFWDWMDTFFTEGGFGTEDSDEGLNTNGDIGSDDGASNFSQPEFDPLVDDRGLYRGPLADMILGTTGAGDLLGQQYIDRLFAPNPYDDIEDSIMQEVMGKIDRDAEKQRQIILNTLGVTNKLDVPLGPSRIQDYEGDVLDAMANARIGFGMKKAETEEPFRRNALQDLFNFNQQNIENLGFGLKTSSADIAQQQRERKQITDDLMADYIKEVGWNNAIIGAQGDYSDEGLRLGMDWVTGQGARGGSSGTDASNIFSTIANRSDQPDRWDEVITTILQGPNFQTGQ